MVIHGLGALQVNTDVDHHKNQILGHTAAVSAPPSQVSKIIKKLEYQWGVELFPREKNNLRLTPAGKHAYKGLNNTLQSVRQTLDEIVHIQAVKPFIWIGCPTLSEPGELFAPMIKRYLDDAPNTEITIECRDNLTSLRKMLLSDEVDLIFTACF